MTEQTTTIPLHFRRETMDQLRTEAKRRGVKVGAFAVEILGSVVAHDLYAAVLGDR
jgi:hypothetical protein